MFKEICVKACLHKDDTSGLGFLRPQSFSKKSTQVFVHEATGPDDVINPVFGCCGFTMLLLLVTEISRWSGISEVVWDQ